MQITPIRNQKDFTTFSAYEKTFVMIKPDSFQRGLDGKIMSGIESAGLSVIKQWSGVPQRAKMEANYSAHKEKPFFAEWMNYLVSGKIKVMILGGDNAVEKAHNLRNELRAKYAPGERRYNLMHASDDVNAAKQEIAKFFDYEA